jgi:hypothetical protein
MEQARVERVQSPDPARDAHHGGAGPVIVNASGRYVPVPVRITAPLRARQPGVSG